MTSLMLSFLGTIPLGFFFGALYDVIRIVRILTGISESGDRRLFSAAYEHGLRDHFKARREGFLRTFLISVGDVLYFILISVFFILYLYRYNDGIFRWFYLVGTVPGFLLYRASLGRVIMGFSRAAADVIALVLNTVVFVLFLPFRGILYVIGSFYGKFLSPAAIKIGSAIDMTKNKYYTDKYKGMINDLVDILDMDMNGSK